MLLTVNGREATISDDQAAVPLLWILREALGLIGAKFGCGQGLCGACTVHLDGEAVRSCQVSAAEAAGKVITTIEGLADAAGLHPVQQAWIAESVPQCGYCQAGQIMAAAALLRQNAMPDDAAIDAAMAGNLCRCGTYQRIRRAIHLAAGQKAGTR
jgi:isoquinoline 1-oxidoreductase alpha subunit